MPCGRRLSPTRQTHRGFGLRVARPPKWRERHSFPRQPRSNLGLDAGNHELDRLDKRRRDRPRLCRHHRPGADSATSRLASLPQPRRHATGHLRGTNPCDRRDRPFGEAKHQLHSLVQSHGPFVARQFSASLEHERRRPLFAGRRLQPLHQLLHRTAALLRIALTMKLQRISRWPGEEKPYRTERRRRRREMIFLNHGFRVVTIAWNWLEWLGRNEAANKVI